MNLKNKSQSFEFKTALYVTSFVLILLLIIYGGGTFLFNVLFERYQLDVVEDLANEIKLVDDNIDEMLNEYANESEVCIIRTLGYEIMAKYNTMMFGCELDETTERISEMMTDFIDSDDDDRTYRFINNRSKTEAVIYSLKVENESIFIYANLEDISQMTNIFRSQIIYLAIGVILVSIILSYIIAQKITEPINKISKRAKFLGTNKLEKFEKSGIKEVDELVDALNLAQSELGKTDELKRDLMANVSHDLKTPLTMIKAYAEMLRDLDCDDKKKREERLNVIIDEADRLTLLVNDILEMSKLQSKGDVLNLEKYNLGIEINKIMDKFQIIKETENYDFDIKVPENIIVKADKNKINQVIYNLVSNAVNYTGDDKKVIVIVKKKGLSYLVEVSDTGKGIKEKDLNRIWDKYYKSEKKHQRNVVSTGIGLSIVKEVLLLHNFNYGVKTSSKGTTFYFIIK